MRDPGSPSLVSVSSAAASCSFSLHWLSLLLGPRWQKMAVFKAPGSLYLLCFRGQPRLKLDTFSPDSKVPTLAQLRPPVAGRVGHRVQIRLARLAWQGGLLRTG